MVIKKEELAELEIKDGELIEISRKSDKGKEPTPPWNMIGNGMSNRTGTSVDFIDICAELNQAELKLLKLLRDEYNNNIRNKVLDTNIIVPSKSEGYSPYISKALEKNYKHLAYMEILVRVKRGTYLINPNLFIPGNGYGMVNKQWEQLIHKNEVSNGK